MGAANINIRALSVAETVDFGILRLIVNDVEKANKVMGQRLPREQNPRRRRGSSRQTGRTAQHYGSRFQRRYQRQIPLRLRRKSGENAVIIFRFDNPEKAIDVLMNKILPLSRVIRFISSNPDIHTFIKNGG